MSWYIDFSSNSLKFLKQKKLKIIYLVLIVFVIIIAVLAFFAFKPAPIPEIEEPIIEEPIEPDVPAVELWQPGQVGEQEQVEENGQEVPQEKEVIDLPAMIFNTIGVVQEIQQDRVIVLGDGSNFADKKPRQLTLLFFSETNLFLADRTQYTGLAGLEYLKPGMQILINSVENIRDRTEFRVLNINVLEF